MPTYLVERHPVWGPTVVSRIARLRAAGDGIAVSDLARLECLVLPFATGNAAVLTDFDAFFRDPAVRVFPLGPPSANGERESVPPTASNLSTPFISPRPQNTAAACS
jgi:hypothetical protein